MSAWPPLVGAIDLTLYYVAVEKVPATRWGPAVVLGESPDDWRPHSTRFESMARNGACVHSVALLTEQQEVGRRQQNNRCVH